MGDIVNVKVLKFFRKCEKFFSDGFGVHDADGTPIAHSYESLWELLEKDHKFKYTVTQRVTKDGMES